MTKEMLMRTLFEQYYDYDEHETADIVNAKFALCEDEQQENEFKSAMSDSAEMAFTAGFNTALTIMGGVQ